MLMQHHVATTDPNTVWHKNVVEWGYGGANIDFKCLMLDLENLKYQ